MGKILLDGLGAVFSGYSQYIELYIHTEEHVEVPPPDNFEEAPFGFLEYDVRNQLKIYFIQFIYCLAIPFIGVKEILVTLYDVYYRDRYGKVRTYP